MNAFVNFVPWFAAESLRADGSNFIEWYRRLRALLQPSGILYTIEKPLGGKPGNGTGWKEVQGFLASRDYYLMI